MPSYINFTLLTLRLLSQKLYYNYFINLAIVSVHPILAGAPTAAAVQCIFGGCEAQIPLHYHHISAVLHSGGRVEKSDECDLC